MSWTVLVLLVCALGVALGAAIARRQDLARMRHVVGERELAVRQGSAEAQLRQPVVDLSRCLGCGTCVEACPEDGVLELVHGQAAVVNGARCVGHAACERECPVGAITVTLTNLESRRDVPVLDGLEATGAPGLFLAGEVTAHALIKTAVDHGTAAAAVIAERCEAEPLAEVDDDLLDLCIVGAGPAGLACALESKRRGLHSVVLEQEAAIGGTVAKYPRRKLVMTQPLDLPLWGKLKGTAYTKEELIELWQWIAEQEALPVRCGEVFTGLERDEDGHFLVRTEASVVRARFVVLALGRRGVPRKLGVPGEELPKVAYSLLDAHSYQGRRIVVVGGGDSAVEAALGLAEQPGNEVLLSYRKERFFRIRSRNEERLRAAVANKTLKVALRSQITAIHPDAVDLVVARDDGEKTVRVPNDEVFVMAGGIAPFELMEAAGVSFDPSMRPATAAPGEQGTGLFAALAAGFTLALATLLWACWHADYYLLDVPDRPASPKHLLLRPGLGLGLALGITAVVLIVTNLLYLLRRSQRWIRRGSLQAWMTSHLVTGVLALLCAMVHGAMAPRDTPGGHAFWALVVLLVSGAIGRYFYAWVPRATNGRELALAEVKAQLADIGDGWEGSRVGFGRRARDEVTELIDSRQWRGTFVGRLLALIGVQLDLRRARSRLARAGAAEGVPPEQIASTLALARRAHRLALTAAHYEDLRALLGTWRWVHRWTALLMVLLVVVHVVLALLYGAHWFEGDGA